jgi:ribosomal protein S18 acetylase RimI-like enzyme
VTAPRIRPAEPGDEDGIARAHVRSWQDAYRGHMPQAFLDGLDVARRTENWRRRLAEATKTPGDVLVLQTGGTIAGFAQYGPSRDEDADELRTGELGAIYLLPESTGRGLGWLLMSAAVDGLSQLGYTDATLWVLEGNLRARRFYERAGWALDGAVQDDVRPGFTIREVRYRRTVSTENTLTAS